MDMIIGRSLTQLNSSGHRGPSADVMWSAAVTTTRAGKCRMSVEAARRILAARYQPKPQARDFAVDWIFGQNEDR